MSHNFVRPERKRTPNPRFTETPPEKKPRPEKTSVSISKTTTQTGKNCKIITLLNPRYLGEEKGWSTEAEYSNQMSMDDYIESIEENLGNQLSKVPNNPGEYQMLIQNAKMNEGGIIHYILYLIPAEHVNLQYRLPDALRDKIIQKITTGLGEKYFIQNKIASIVEEIKKLEKSEYTLIAIPQDVPMYAKTPYNDIFKQYINGHKKVVDVVDCDAIVSDRGGSPSYKKKRHIYKTRKGKGRIGKSKSKSKSRKLNRRY
jgi:hypothetical protein